MSKRTELPSSKALLHQAGYKATPARLAILELLQQSKQPLGIMEMAEKLRGYNIDKVTMYRVLATLEASRLVRKVNLQHSHADYEFAADDHHHLVCTSCGRIEDFGDCGLDKLAVKILRQSRQFVKVDHHSLEFFGLCASCSQ